MTHDRRAARARRKERSPRLPHSNGASQGAEPASVREGAWRAGVLTGAVSASFSTFLVGLGAGRIGRTAARDWMDVGTVLLRGGGVRVQPGWREVLAGILVHQSADLSWASLYFGAGIGRPRGGRKAALLALAAPWAVATSAVEYYLILPWLQPLLRMETPYWTALSVHVASALAYPLFPWIQGRVADRPSPDDTAFSGRAAGALLGLAGFVAALAALERSGHGAYWPLAGSRAREADRTFLRHMTAHHELGVRLSRLLADKAVQGELRLLGRLMLGDHLAELGVMRTWWRQWFGGAVPPITAEERDTMEGMPPPEDIEALEQLSGTDFEARYIPTMVDHHEGAIAMCNHLWQEPGDPRLRLFADSIRHTQRGQVARMWALYPRRP